MDELEHLSIDTDGAFMGTLQEELVNAFPAADIELEGPVHKALLPEGAIQWTFAGTMAVFTVTGGIGPAVESLKAIVTYLIDGYRAGRGRERTLRPTTFRHRERELSVEGDSVTYRDTEVSIEVPPGDVEAVMEGLRKVLGSTSPPSAS